jgi:hypothetical protein
LRMRFWDVVLRRGFETRFFVLFLKEKNQKNFLWVLVKGLYVNLTDIPYESLGYRDLKRHPRSFI